MKTAIFLTSLLGVLALIDAVPAEKPSDIFDAFMQYGFLSPALKEDGQISNDEDTSNNLVMKVLMSSILDGERNHIMAKEAANQYANQNSWNIFDLVRMQKCMHICMQQE